jgi:hypothetical protein
MNLILEALKKFVGFIVFLVGLTFTGVKWHQSELEAVELKVISKVKEFRQDDMRHLDTQLNDIKGDVRIIKKILMEGKN